MTNDITTRNQEKQAVQPSSSSKAFDPAKNKSRQLDLEKGLADNGSYERGRTENFRREVKQQYKKDFHSSQDQMDTLFSSNESHESDNVAIEQKVDKIVTWLKKDVLNITSDRESKIHEKVRFCLEQRPITAKLLEQGIQLQKARDEQIQRYGASTLILMDSWFGSALSSAKEKITTALKEDRARYNHLLGEVDRHGGNNSWFYSAHKGEISKLEDKVENANILKEKITKVRIDAISLHQKYKKILDTLVDEGKISDTEKELEQHKFDTSLRTIAAQEINALKTSLRSDSQKEELKKAQHHTTHGVGLGNVLHVIEMLPGYASLALSALAEKQAAEALAINKKNN